MRYFRFSDNTGGTDWPITTAMAVVGCLIVFAPVWAMEGHWTISTAEGTAVLIVNGNEEIAATQGFPVAAGATLVTGDDGRVTLVRRGDSMTVYPNSEVTIPAPSDAGHMGVVQSLGRLLFRMETRESRNFEVRTPFLAATVKGTVFTVDVAPDHATVTVAEGSVLVAPVRGGRSELVGAGNRGSVKANSPNRVDVEKVAAGQSPNSGKSGIRGKPAGGRSRDAVSARANSHGNESRGNGSKGGDSGTNESQGSGAQGDEQ